MSIHVLGISGSLRKASCNTGLLREYAQQLPADVQFELADLSAVPLFNADNPEPPASVLALFDQMAKASALVLACPEYNYSIAPALKNALDWASRQKDNHLMAGKAVAILGAGGGMGTARAQYHLRQVCVYLDLKPLNKPEVFANAFAGGFDAQGNVIDEKIKNNIKTQSDALLEWVRILSC